MRPSPTASDHAILRAAGIEAGEAGEAAATTAPLWPLVAKAAGTLLAVTALVGTTAGVRNGGGDTTLQVASPQAQAAATGPSVRQQEEAAQAMALLQLIGHQLQAAGQAQQYRQTGTEDATIEAMRRSGYDVGDHRRNRWGGFTKFDAEGDLLWATDATGNYVIPPAQQLGGYR